MKRKAEETTEHIPPKILTDEANLQPFIENSHVEIIEENETDRIHNTTKMVQVSALTSRFVKIDYIL